MALAITENNFEELVSKSGKPVLLDFWAVWCGPCKQISPIIDEIADEFEGKAVVGKVDVDGNSDISARFRVRNIPTLIFIKNGEQVDKLVGAVKKEQIVEKLNSLL